MGALRKSELAYPHEPYIEELHDFFAAQGLHYGAPMDLVQLVDRLDDPGLFHEDMRRIVRSILAREPMGIPRSDMLAILAVAIGGPMVYRSAEQLRQPLSRLLEFLDGVLRRSPPQSEVTAKGELIQFPATTAATPEPEEPAASSTNARVWLTSIPRSAVRKLRPLARPSPSFRNTMLVAAGAVVLVVLLFLLMHPRSSTAVSYGHVPSGYSAAKPSPYGEAFVPDFTPFVRYGESGPAAFSPAPGDSTPASDLDSAAFAAQPADSTSTVADSASPELAAIAPEPQAVLNLELEHLTPPSPLSLNLSPEFSSTPQVQPAAAPAAAEPAPQPAAATSDVQPPAGL